MKMTILTILIMMFTTITFSQSKSDIKDFIMEKVDANDPIPSYDNAIFFQNILRPDAEKLAGRSISDEEFENLFIYARDCYSDKTRTKWGWTVSQAIDLRGISKVSTTNTVGSRSYYTITIYMNSGYLAKEYHNSIVNKPEWKNIDKMEILISDNKEAAQQIKKGIIKLCELSGITAKDGDLF